MCPLISRRMHTAMHNLSGVTFGPFASARAFRSEDGAGRRVQQPCGVREDRGESSRGHHNLNYVVRPSEEISLGLPALARHDRVTVRRRMRHALPVVIRTWQDEAEILRSIRGALPHVPQCLVKHGDVTVLSYVQGVPLSTICRSGKPLEPHLISALAGLLADMTQVKRKDLPPLPQSWPRTSRDSRAFLGLLRSRPRNRSGSPTGAGSEGCSPRSAFLTTRWCGSRRGCRDGQPSLQPAPHGSAP